MSLLGSYLVLKVEGVVIGETTKVNLKMTAEANDTTSQDSGLRSSYNAGKINIRMSGAFLFASSGNWDTLYTYLKTGNEMGISLFVNGAEILSGYGYIRKLNLKGADEASLVTGAYRIVYNTDTTVQEVDAILTETGIEITTETGTVITTE